MKRFEHVRPDGKVTILPRMLVEMRRFNPATQGYERMDITLGKAPIGEAAKLKWFDEFASEMKSKFHGAPATDQDMLDFYEKEILENEQYKKMVEQMGKNKWIQRFESTKGKIAKE